MQSISNHTVVFLALIPSEDLARYIVTAFFTIINLMVTYFVLKKFLFKPAMNFMKKRQAGIEEEIKNAKTVSRSADARLNEVSLQIEKSIREASTIVNDAKVQAESQSNTLIEEAKKEAAEIITRADQDIERMRSTMMEEMRDEVAELAVSIASKVITQTINEEKQRELVDQFIGEEMKGKE